MSCHPAHGMLEVNLYGSWLLGRNQGTRQGR